MVPFADLGEAKIFRGGQVILQDRGRLGISRFKSCQESLGLSPKMVEVWTSWKNFLHNAFCRERLDPQTGGTMDVQLSLLKSEVGLDPFRGSGGSLPAAGEFMRYAIKCQQISGGFVTP